jgi:hypothetical protein
LNIVERLPVLEPQYITYALQHHLGALPSSRSQASGLIASHLLHANEFNMIAYRDLLDLQARLLEPDLAEKLVVTLTNWDADMIRSEQNTSEVKGIEMCKRLNEAPLCGQLCRK